ncbi:MAG: flavin reductase family protein [Pseudomonadota bacterium]
MHDVLPSSPIDTAAFRRLMAQFATGVCVVSAEADDGRIVGITVNSFVSVSLEPLLVAWSLQNSSSQFDLWSQTQQFAISILAEGQQDLAQRHASRKRTDLDADEFSRSERGLPVIDGALGHLECRQWSLYPAGDHTLVFGEVMGIHQTVAGRPLGFFGGAFCRIAE